VARPNIAFTTVLVGAMAGSSFALFGISVLAADLIDEFDVSRGRIGILLAANTAIGAACAPILGRLTDQIGGRRSIMVLLTVSAVGLALVAAATSYWMLVFGAVVAGAPQGWANPATNKLIVDNLDAGNRGTVLGIKQSGVQLSVFLSGATLPIAAQSFGWRSGIAIYAALCLGLVVATAVILEPDPPTEPSTARQRKNARAPLGPLVISIAIYATAMGMAGGMINRFVPLFAHEELGYSTTVAGMAAALTGLLAIATRIWWSAAAERNNNTISPLIIMALGAMITALLLSIATTVGAWLLWPVAVAGALSVSAWNGVAMLRLVNGVDSEAAGRASGIVIFGFLGGLAIGAPLAGWSVDQWGTYAVAWSAAVVLAFIAMMAIASPISRRATVD
jgi:predicted MFS family arabinose efflux permease